MSIYSNRADRSARDARRYVEAVLELLGTQDARVVLGETPGWCRARTGGLTPAQLAAPEAPGKWSIAAVLQHLADSELVWGYRLRKVLAEHRPALTGFDQDLWADRLDYAHADREAALAMFSALRAANLRLLDGMSAADLERVGVHAERGEETVAHMIRLYAGHDLVHRRQLDRMLG